jgi:hypothetical protein
MALDMAAVLSQMPVQSVVWRVIGSDVVQPVHMRRPDPRTSKQECSK